MDKEIIGHIVKNAIEKKKKLIVKEVVKLPDNIGNVKEQNGKRINIGVKVLRRKWGL
jgi:hypothetical protein